ncbi:Hypothetical predicted protein [Paramuricea clavata]|uniref:Uncharacterized protein n=1 Tax=Paramuricea clavata TaxID=317549 RepID=A0A6S7HY71_PARCT|nr:Hypothetical predicted protein [Paramuricea clavata]
MIRSEGRIEHFSVSSKAKKPVLLPAKHHVTDLIIQVHHDSANHTGIKGTLNRIRERYWILRGRQAVKRVTCKRLEGKPYPKPKTPHLPSWRTSDDPPFSYTGVDFAGPPNVKENSKREYLLSIREAASSCNNGTRDVIAEGDIVILKNESTKPSFWKIAKELIRSIDGVVRSAKIRVLKSETRKPIIIRRPIQHLIPLETRSKFGNEDEEELVDVNDESPGTQDLSTEPLKTDYATLL